MDPKNMLPALQADQDAEYALLIKGLQEQLSRFKDNQYADRQGMFGPRMGKAEYKLWRQRVMRQIRAQIKENSKPRPLYLHEIGAGGDEVAAYYLEGKIPWDIYHFFRVPLDKIINLENYPNI